MSDCSCDYCLRVNPDRINDCLIDEPEARKFLGSVSHMWVRRRMRNPRFAFPTRVELGRRRFFWKSDLAAWVGSPHAALRTERNFALSSYIEAARGELPITQNSRDGGGKESFAPSPHLSLMPAASRAGSTKEGKAIQD